MKQCIFCKRVSTHARYFNKQEVQLCQDHYETKTLGEIAEQLRKHPIKEEVKPKVIETKELTGGININKPRWKSKLKADGYPFDKLKRKK